MQNLKIGDQVVVTNDRQTLAIYYADLAAGKAGKIIDKYNADLSSYAKSILGLLPTTNVFVVELSNKQKVDIFEIHLTLDIDSLPYHEWVKARDWNKVYKQQFQKLVEK